MTKVEYANASLNGNLRHKPRDKMQALRHGLREKCPNCGEGAVYTTYLKIADHCDHCGEALHHEKSDDAAPYFTIFALGHIIVPLLLILETRIFPPFWIYAVLGIPLIVALTLFILPRIKGAVVGWQWALYMHGFNPDEGKKTDLQLNKDIIG